MEVGALFPSYQAFAAALAEYQKKNFVHFFMKSTRTIVGARKKGIKRFVKDELQFYEITCSCVHGGRIHKSKSAGIRPQQKTLKFGCPAELKVTVSKDGQHLEIKNVVNQHNHPTNEATYKQMLKQKGVLSSPDDAEGTTPAKKKRRRIKSFLNNPDVVELLHGSTEVSSTTEDQDGGIGTSTVEALAAQVQANGGVMDILVDECENLTGIFYQDPYMCRAFACFPEVVFVETICRSEQTTPFYLVSVEDSNGEIAVIAVLFCASESSDTLTATFQRLAFHCGDSVVSRTKVVMTDKGFSGCEVLKEVFQNARHVLSLSRVLRTFKKDITVNKMTLSVVERQTALEILQQMCYIQHEDQYDMLLEELECIGNAKLTAYFHENWHGIRHEWVRGLQRDTVAFVNRSSSRVEHISNRIAGVITKYKNLGETIRYLVLVTDSLRQERDQRILDALLRQPTYPSMSDVERRYGEHLTPYAFNVVVTQLKHGAALERLGGATIPGSTHACDCPLSTLMELPCKHILYRRRVAGLDLFFPGGIGLRWTRKYYKDSRNLNATSDGDSSDGHVRGVLSEQEKYKEVSDLTEQLATQISKLPMDKYENMLSAVSRMVELVVKGADVGISEIMTTVESLDEDRTVTISEVCTTEEVL
ncbi:uncharacterized protein LOC135392605 [Ornithodoros turicata]|uniref:uncharacterized protein LOC135392605 n=1 Tax=Ornithodoros turicata TaxID=34597 RepID=UPI0031391A8E